jgi:hypothetical protein
MPTARQTAGKLLGRTALLQLAGSEDKEAFFRELMSSVVLKEDLKIQDAAQENPAPGTFSLPGARETLMTTDGGFAIRLLADESMPRGTVVTAGAAGYSSCRPHDASSKEPPIGVTHTSVNAGDVVSVVVAGMARVLTVSDGGGGS